MTNKMLFNIKVEWSGVEGSVLCPKKNYYAYMEEVSSVGEGNQSVQRKPSAHSANKLTHFLTLRFSPRRTLPTKLPQW